MVNQSMETFVAAALKTTNHHPKNKLLQTLYDQLDNHFNFSLGPLVTALSNTQQLKQLVKKQPAYIRNYVDDIKKCLDFKNCKIESGTSHVAGVVADFKCEN